MNVLFFHGLDSNKETTKYKAINHPKFCETVNYTKDSYTCIYEKYKAAYSLVKPNVIIGHSLGGYWALKLALEFKKPCILLNPQLFPKNNRISCVQLYKDFSYIDTINDSIPIFMYIETNDDIINVNKTINLLRHHHIEVFNGGNHKLEHPERVNNLITLIK